MNLNKTFGRVATTFVAATMLAAFSAVPASAENATVIFTKTINMAGSGADYASVPNVSYSYSVAPGTAVDGNDTTPKIFAGEADDLSISSISFSPADDAQIDKGKISKNATVTFAEGAYTVPGIYRYTVTETDPTDPDMTCDNDTYTLDVYVVNDTSSASGTKVETAVWTRGTPITPILDSNNNAIYGENEEAARAAKITGDEDTYTTYQLTVTKAVAGAMADASRKYNFTVNLGGLDNGAKVAVDGVKTSDGATNGALSVTGIQLQPNGDDEIVIAGLPSDAKYTIIEALNKSEGYTVKVGTTELTYDNKDATYSTNEATQGKADASVTVVNERDAVSPTGIVMNVAPYVLLVVVAAAGCFVFLRKRRED